MNLLQQHYHGQYPQLIMFDLDGTLVDSAPDIAIAVNKTLKDLNLPTVSEESVRCWVGNGADVLIRRAITNGDDNQSVEQALLTKAYDILLGYYPYHHDIKYVYEGVQSFLAFMQQQSVKMAIVTNKPVEFVEPLLKELDLNQYFEWIIGGGSLPQKKPAPEPLFYVLEKTNILPEQALFVGDSRNDVRAAKAAGVPCAALTYGYNHGEPIANESPAWVISNLNDLLKVFAK